jgi:hypothetical protein
MNRRLLTGIMSFAGITFAIFIVLIGILTLLGPLMSQPRSPQQKQEYIDNLFADYRDNLDIARKRWSEQSLSEYRLLIVRYDSFHNSCRQDLTVEQEEVTVTYTNTCEARGYNQLYHQTEAGIQPSETVSELFEQIERDTSEMIWIDKCTFLVLDITYNPTRGYPEQITYRWEQFLDSGCSLMERSNGPEIEITLTPLESK